jgi:predicted alpha/beta hydrolase family esterase
MQATGPLEASFLILHGIAYDGSRDHWHNRLARRLDELGHPVRYPQLPAPGAPRLADWLAVLRRELDEMTQPGAQRVVVCHSLGCLLWIHHAGQLSRPVDRLLLVAPPEDAQVPLPGDEFRVGHADPAAIRGSSVVPPRLVRGDLDPYSPSGVPEWAVESGCKIDRLAGVAHLNPDDGHGPWPSCERWCLDPATELQA